MNTSSRPSGVAAAGGVTPPPDTDARPDIYAILHREIGKDLAWALTERIEAALGWRDTRTLDATTILRELAGSYDPMIPEALPVIDALRSGADALAGGVGVALPDTPPPADEPTAIELAADEMLTALYRIRADRPSAHSDAVWSMLNDAIEVGQAAFDGRAAAAGEPLTPQPEHHAMSGNVDVSIYEFNGYDQVHVRAGRQRGRIVCEGQPWEREVFDWDHNIEVTVSPTGRSVRVFIDGIEYGPRSAGGGSGETDQ